MWRRRLIAIVAWAPAVACLAFALLRVSGAGGGFPLFPLLAFAPWVAAVAVAAALMALLLRRRGAAGVAALAALLLVIVVLPRTRADAQPADFNSTLDEPAFREVLGRGWHDAADVLGKGLVATWPTDRPGPPLFAIDHVLGDGRVAFSELDAHDVPGSDHRALVVTATPADG